MSLFYLACFTVLFYYSGRGGGGGEGILGSLTVLHVTCNVLEKTLFTESQ